MTWDRNLARATAALRDELDEIRAQLEQAEGAGVRYDSFRAYVDAASGGRFRWYRHAVVLAEVLQRVADGELLRAIVMMPPRHGKSEEIARLFPGYYVQRFPDRWVGIASYSGDLAQGFSRAARGNFREAGGVVSDEASATREWMTPQGGGVWASGVGGVLTGRGFHLGIIDDPTKSHEQAESELERQKAQDWYASVFRTRCEPGAAIVLVTTRWHEDDLAGWLLEREPQALERWHVINLPARCEPVEERPEFPETCTVEPDWRAPGEALCPERFPEAALEGIEAAIGSRAWASLYMQRPTPPEGNLFKRSWFGIVDQVPANARRIRYWDTAGTDGRGDFTAGVLLAKDQRGVYYVEDVVRGQWSPGRRDGWIRLTADNDKLVHGAFPIWLEQEAGVAGQDRTDATVRLLAGHSVRAERPTGPKEVRADPFAAQCEAGNVKIRRATWNTAFLDELCSFPYGSHDDQVDAASGAFMKLSVPPIIGRMASSPWGEAPPWWAQ